MRKLKLVKNAINEAASYTNFLVIKSRAIYLRLLAMPVEMNKRSGSIRLFLDVVAKDEAEFKYAPELVGIRSCLAKDGSRRVA